MFAILLLAACTLTPPATPTTPTTPARTASFDDSALRAEITALKARVAELERRDDSSRGQTTYSPDANDYDFKRAVQHVTERCTPECRMDCDLRGDDVECEVRCDIDC